MTANDPVRGKELAWSGKYPAPAPLDDVPDVVADAMPVAELLNCVNAS